MSYMFEGYGAGSSCLNAVLDVSKWKTSVVTDMSSMFYRFARNSTDINAVPDVSNWDTSSVTDMSYMFNDFAYWSTDLNAVPDVSNWDTSSVTDMSYMFDHYGYTSLTVVPDVSKWDTSSVKNMTSMFAYYGRSSNELIFTLDLSDWDITSLVEATEMFDRTGENALAWSVTIPAKTGEKDNDATHWYLANDRFYIKPDTGRAFSFPKSFKAVYDEDTDTLTFYYDDEDHSDEGTVFDNLPTDADSADDWGYNSIRGSVKFVVIDSSLTNFKGLTSTAHMFADMNNANSITGAEYLNTSRVTDMSYMFYSYGYYGCITPDVSKWNTRNVKSISSMFAGASFESAPDVSAWNTASMEDVSNAFANFGMFGSSEDFSLDLSGWDISHVTNGDGMFSGLGDYIHPSIWSVIIPAKTGEKSNDATHWYLAVGWKYIASPDSHGPDGDWDDLCFTLAN